MPDDRRAEGAVTSLAFGPLLAACAAGADVVLGVAAALIFWSSVGPTDMED